MCFQVILLGTGSAIPTLSRGTTAQFVNVQQRKILIDCGEGTQLNFRKHRLKFQDLQILLISHLHGDHVLGLPGLLSTMQLLGRTLPLKIIGPKGIKNYVKYQFELTKGYQDFPIEFLEINRPEFQLIFEDKCIEIVAFPLQHRIPTFGYRINEKVGKRPLNKSAFDKTGVSVAYINKLKSGLDIVDNNGVVVKAAAVTYAPKPTKSYAYCSDTAYDEKIVSFIRNVDLLYHEATFVDKEMERAKKTFHSTAAQAAQIAQLAKAKRLILGHFSARYKTMETHLQEATAIFTPTFIPKDGEVFWV